jgi:hypothetical protein
MMPMARLVCTAVFAACAWPSAVPAAPSIPAQFRGIWWDTLQHCRDELSDTHLRIDASSLNFYESRGVARHVSAKGPRTVAITAAMGEEGERWTQTFVFRLSTDGSMLTDETDPAKPLKRVRCPDR